MYNQEFALLGELLTKSLLVTEQQIDVALEKQKQVKKKLGALLIEMGALSEDDLIGVLGKQMNVELAGRSDFSVIDLSLVRLIPEPFAREYKVIPLKQQDGALHVAMIDPENITIIDNLRKLTRSEIVPALAGQSMIEAAINKSYDAIQKSGEVDTVLSGLEFDIRDEDGEASVDLSAISKDTDDAPIVKIVNIIMVGALKDRATDIHIEPQTDKLIVRFRIDGALVEIMTVPIKSHSGIVSRIKIMSKLNIAESRLPQDGRFTIRMPDRQVDVRVSVLPTVTGEKIVMRILDKGFFDLSLVKLGFSAGDLELFRRCISMPYGIIIISGPTGSGKSTTLYAALNEIKSSEDNIVTVEDPVEYQIDGIAQVATNDKINMSFGVALRSILRQDPDKILIGEIRDRETADSAMKFALTGHLVFTTVHANDAPSTITRLIDIGVLPFLVGSSLVLVMSQRLVRTICDECKEEYKPTEREFELLNLHDKDRERKFYHGKGCARCRNTGYYGRTGIFELMHLTQPIRKLVFSGADQEQIRQMAIELKMKTLR